MGHQKKVLLQVRSRQVQRLQKEGVTFTHRPPLFPQLLTQACPQSAQQVGAVFCCVKAHQLWEALEPWLQFLPPSTPVVLVQNGWGSENKVICHRPEANWWLASTTQSAWFDEEKQLSLGKKGAWVLAPWCRNQEPPPLLQDLFRPHQIYHDPLSLRGSKLLLNLMGNLTTAVTTLNLSQWLSLKGSIALEIGLIKETAIMIRHLGIRLENLPDYPARKLAQLTLTAPAFLIGPYLKRKMLAGRGKKEPSFYYDAIKGVIPYEFNYLSHILSDFMQPKKYHLPTHSYLQKLALNIPLVASFSQKEKLAYAQNVIQRYHTKEDLYGRAN